MGAAIPAMMPGATVSYSVEGPADYQATDLVVDASGVRFLLRYEGRKYPAAIPTPGRFSVSNALAALATCHIQGHELSGLVAALERMPRIPGRFEYFAAPRGISVIVDYAHSPDSLDKVLDTIRDFASGRVLRDHAEEPRRQREYEDEAIAAITTVVRELSSLVEEHGGVVAGTPWFSGAGEPDEQGRQALTEEVPQWLVKVPVRVGSGVVARVLVALDEGAEVQAFEALEELSIHIAGGVQGPNSARPLPSCRPGPQKVSSPMCPGCVTSCTRTVSRP
ncbi:cyanophycin synthetase [Nocardiopsis sp. NPDC006832]|uniref:glutamate ligase domain-containing protein n=1 Tax=Nocardiopsis sp. NPDC006832 TaxID=3157188 RepID=UPI00340D4297